MLFVSGTPNSLSRLFKRVFLAITLFLSAGVLHAEEPLDELYFTHLDEEGVSVGTIEAILQDSYGYMWFGGSEGLLKYDGYNYKIFRNRLDDDSSISNNIVWDILEDSKGQLWIATDSGLNLYKRETETFTRYFYQENANSLPVNDTRSLVEDKNGNLWIATTNGLSKFNADRSAFTNYKHSPNNPNSLSSNELRRVYIGKDPNKLWIGNYVTGLNVLNLKDESVTRFPFNVKDGKGLSHGVLNTLHEDDHGNMWLGTDGGGLNRLNLATGKFHYYLSDDNDITTLGSNVVTRIISNQNNELWIATERGLHFYNRAKDSFKQYLKNHYHKQSLLSDNIHTIYFDRNKDLWLGYFPSGVGFLDTSNTVFKTFRHNPADPNSLNRSSVLSLKENPKGTLWVGTDGGGLNKMDIETEQFVHYNHDPNDPQSLSARAALTIEPDAKGNLWVGTWHGGLNYFDTKENKATRYKFDALNPKSLANDNVWSIVLDQRQNLWAGTIGGGLARLKNGSTQFESFNKTHPDNNVFVIVWKVFESRDGTIWIGTNQGLGKYVSSIGQFKFYRHNANDEESLSFDVVVDIEEDRKNRLWIATRGGGLNLFNKQTEKFTAYREQHGLPSDVVKSVKEDKFGNLWLGSEKGLTKFEVDSERFVTYTEHNGLQGNVFNFGSGLKLSNGNMVFGGTNGFTVFDPEALKTSSNISPVEIVEFQIFNKTVPIGAEGSPLSKDISLTEEITLDHQQTVFSFSFSTLSFRNPKKNEFAYILEGFESEWNYVNADRRNVTYTNLDPGTYTFRVKAANSEGVWNEQGRSIVVHILPPPWKTWWAYVGYVLLGLAFIAIVVYSQIIRLKRAEKQSRLLEQKVSERTAELRVKNNDIEAMLSNMRQGLFTIEENGRIHGEYSKFLEEIFATENIAGEDVYEFLFQHAILSRDELDQIKASIFSIIGEDELNFSFNAHLLPTEYLMNIKGKLKFIALDWSPLQTDEGVLRIMVTVRDVTELKKAEAESVKQQREMTMVGHLIKVKNNRFYSFESSVTVLLAQCVELLTQEKEITEQDIEKLFRNVHTFKGNSRTLGLALASEAAHIAEGAIADQSEREEGINQTELLNNIRDIERVFEEYRDVFYNVLDRDERMDEEGYWLRKSTLGYVRQSLRHIESRKHGAEVSNEIENIEKAIDNDISQPLSLVVNDIVNSLPSIAAEIDKASPLIKFDEGNVKILPNAFGLMNDVFIHLLRNAIDHGIETEQERRRRGKPYHGVVDIDVKVTGKFLTIKMRDDGQGLDMKHLYYRGLKMGVFKEGVQPETDDIAQLIFKSGISTKDKVTAISGRGVGMDAVRRFLHDKNGTIEIELDYANEHNNFIPFEIIIVVPEDCYIQAQSLSDYSDVAEFKQA